MSSSKMAFAETLAISTLGTTAYSVMTDCEKYGMVSGCDEGCPQWQRGECENGFEPEEAEVSE